MSEKYNSVFEEVLNYVKGSPMAAWLMLMSIAMLAIGINGFVEDTNSSYIGIQQLETTFGVRAVSWEATYLFMSLFFQIATVVAFFMYLSNRTKNWAWLWASIGFQLVDFCADVWYRSNGDPFRSMGGLFVSLILTFVFYTIGSEIAISIGLGLTAKLFVEGMTQLSIIVWSVMAGLSKFLQNMSSPTKTTHEQPKVSFPQNKQEFPGVPHHYTEKQQQFRAENPREDMTIVGGNNNNKGTPFRPDNRK